MAYNNSTPPLNITPILSIGTQFESKHNLNRNNTAGVTPYTVMVVGDQSYQHYHNYILSIH
jgi:hypothetical protein